MAARIAIGSAAIALASRDLAISHQSACLLYGLPAPLRGWGRPTFCGDHGPTRGRHDVHVLVAPLQDRDVSSSPVGLVTSPARTVADCLRRLPPADALAVADAAIRRGLDMADVRATLDRQRGWPGVVRARELVALVSHRRESALESWSAWFFHEWAVPTPGWQIEVRDPTGAFCGRVDSWWPSGVVGEADGRAKYALAAAERGGADAAGLARVLDAERAREQRIRRTGADVVRWGTRDVRGAGRRELARHVVTRLQTAARSGQFAGRTVVPPLMLPEPTLGSSFQPSSLSVRGA